jgi:adenylate cyclase
MPAGAPGKGGNPRNSIGGPQPDSHIMFAPHPGAPEVPGRDLSAGDRCGRGGSLVSQNAKTSGARQAPGVRQARSYRQVLASAVLALAVVVLLQNGKVLPRLEWLAGDFLQRLDIAGSPPHPDLMFVVLDQKSLDAGTTSYSFSWPWPRRTLAQAVHFLHRAGARAIWLDFPLSEPSLYGPEDDQALATAMRDGGKVWLPIRTRTRAPIANPLAWSALRTLLPRDPVIGTDALLPDQRGGNLPIPELAAAARGIGDARRLPDADGVVRRIPPVVRLGTDVLADYGLAPIVKTRIPGWLRLFRDRVELGGRVLPLDAEGCLVLRFPGSWEAYPRVSLIDLIAADEALVKGLAPALDPERFRNKWVAVGVTAEELFEPHKIPLPGGVPDIFLAASAWTAATDGRVYQERWKPLLAWPLLLVLAGLGALWGRQRFGLAVWLGALTLVAYLAIFVWLYYARHVVLSLVSPTSGFLMAFALSLSLSYLREQRQKHFIQNAFSQMLSTTVLQRLLHDPQRLATGGELAEVTIYFSDLAGFTAFSERLDPHTLVSLLNTYFREMIATISEETGGYVDKLIGDAVMAFWGAPLPDRDHAFKACQAALRNQEKMERLRARMGKEFPLRQRIGIHTGPVVVGMLGSPSKLNYTVIGDAVNLASRLEGANKVYGTEIILSEHTYRRVQERVVVRELDTLQVKGKSKPCRIYELLGLTRQVPTPLLRGLTDYEQGMRLFHERKFRAAGQAFRRAEDARPGDPVIQVYVDRCRRFSLKPPPPNWDGVTALKNK